MAFNNFFFVEVLLLGAVLFLQLRGAAVGRTIGDAVATPQYKNRQHLLLRPKKPG